MWSGHRTAHTCLHLPSSSGYVILTNGPAGAYTNASQRNLLRVKLTSTGHEGVGCGAAASGHYEWNNPEQIGQLMLCMVMSGPLLTGYTQTINDWYDREIDAINEPNRPIPSGRIGEGDVIAQIWVLLLGGIAAAAVLDAYGPSSCSELMQSPSC
jgi:hypothetical protein